MDALEATFVGMLAFNSLEDPGDAAANPEILRQAFDFGRSIVLE